MSLYTIGFTKKKAKEFFGRIRAAGISRVIDVRLNNVSQLAGFAKRDDLVFFLQEICGCGYEHRPEWAPTQDVLDAYRGKSMDWPGYERRFNELLEFRRIEGSIQRDALHMACLLCSEATPECCHRRLVAQYLQAKLGNMQITHL
ncbi:DUF488 domain-containing protein [Desulfovibrio sulfodismutans]|uniref:DUF488 domain-containing protein n=1 Tax=Desulfolutivibrio sulfodismutans TaxID=63561 RepID=A0A7K3NQU6_9BACT|nr:DUF488 domain-containing protein [Desulfolutivibrio sulfodismutans]QLA14444.1 DUF488 family protein [Desulfolutivibrio sulfodismutans DSM 3696]